LTRKQKELARAQMKCVDPKKEKKLFSLRPGREFAKESKYLKYKESEMGAGVGTQVVECLPSKWEALSLNSSTEK
jgi:hypothetical protein